MGLRMGRLLGHLGLPNLADTWEIDRSTITFKKELDAGAFSTAWHCTCKGVEVTVKKYKPGPLSKKAFHDEAAILKRFRHPKLVALSALCSTFEPLLLMHELMCYGSLVNYLRNDVTGPTVKYNDLLYFAAQVARGMEYLENNYVIHRDLAARNVLVGPNNKVKISNFELGVVAKDYMAESETLAVRWTAVESMVHGKFSTKSDVWSYGVLLMEIFTRGMVPYCGMQTRDVIEQVEKGYRMPRPTNKEVNDELYQVMLKCWDNTPEKRPAFSFLCCYFEDSITTPI